MPEARLGGLRLTCLVILSTLALFPGLGSSRHLTYHEAFVAQGAREILDSGNWGYPTIGGVPWLEKPPLPWWLVAMVARCTGVVTETVARFPSALAAIGLVSGIALLGTRHYGSQIGLLAGAIQATTAWTVLRGRLAEADIVLACLITWTIVAFDRILATPTANLSESPRVLEKRWRRWRWVFFVLLGITALVKGIGFGAALILSVVAVILLWQRDSVSLRRLRVPAGWALALVIAISWPLLMVAEHGYGVLSLWTRHVSDRLIVDPGPGPFAGEPWQEYILGLLGQALPWTPLAVAGAWRSLVRASLHREYRSGVRVAVPATVVSGDRLLCVWAIVPLVLLALAPVKNAHYVISAQVPWSIWAALSLVRLGRQFQFRRWDRRTLIRAVRVGFIMLALAYGLGFWLLGPWFDGRGIEWAFYETAGRQVPDDIPLTLVYDDWDRNPYESSFGPIPHDLAVRLFYLGRSACWHIEPGSLLAHNHGSGKFSSVASPLVADQSPAYGRQGPLAVIGRDRDLPILQQLGHIEVIAEGPSMRRDRTYTLFRVTSRSEEPRSVVHGQSRPIY